MYPTGTVLIHHILEVFEKFGLTETEVKKHVVFISDRGKNIKYGLIRAGFIRLTCYAHIVHNLVSHMLGDERVKGIIKQCSTLSNYVKNTGLNPKLKTSLKTYTSTRWNSVFTMVDAILKNYKEVYELMIMKQRLRNEYRLKNRQQPDAEISDLITVIDTKELEAICQFLKPFKVCNKLLKIFQVSI